jgi:hypothetical protein
MEWYVGRGRVRGVEEGGGLTMMDVFQSADLLWSYDSAAPMTVSQACLDD